MNVTATSASAATIDADAVVVVHHQDGPLAGPAAELDQASDGVLTRLLEAEEITGKQGELTTILAASGITATSVVVAGMGVARELDRASVQRGIGAAAKKLAEKQRQRVAFYPGPDWNADLVASGVAAAAAGCTGQDLYRAAKKLHPFGEIVWGTDRSEALARGQILGASVNLTRELVNQPAGELFPAAFADRAEALAADAGLEVEVWDQQRLEAERCGSLLQVARGSSQPPRLVILKHKRRPATQPPLGLVGKGVTFDSGGLSIKPSDGMKTMKCDMAGAATVLGAMQAIGRLNVPVNVIGLLGLVENMISGDSYKLGDVLHSRNGKTIEVLNTDAEGRLVLADVLDVAVERGVDRLVDLATLTGACVVALGTDVAGLMTNRQSWCQKVLAAAEACGERAWQLPMFDEYAEQIQSKVADIKNIGEGRWGGAITAAKFLEEFVQDKPWVHIDIAGPAFQENAKPWLDAGGTGAFVRTLIELVEAEN